MKESNYNLADVFDSSPLQDFCRDIYMFFKDHLVLHQERSCKSDLCTIFALMALFQNLAIVKMMAGIPGCHSKNIVRKYCS